MVSWVGFRVLVLFWAAFSSLTLAAQVLLETPQGWARGKQVDGGRVVAFLGLPYAHAARWKAPVSVTKWPGVFNATHLGLACLQHPVISVRLGEALPPMSEDCLNLNVWRPVVAPPPGGFPVMVFVHGGSFTDGSGTEPLYNGANLARKGVLVVTINYRLGVFGFLALPKLAAEDPHHSTGNYGLLDQIAALQWVQRNVAAFGGNRGNITLFGQSSGAMSVCDLMTSPLARGLFEKAILESGGCDQVRPLGPDFRYGEQWAAQHGCPGADPACLRALPASVVLGSEPGVFKILVKREKIDPFSESPYKPHIDGYALTELPQLALEQGRASGIALIAGSNTEEYGLALLDPFELPSSWPALKARMKRELGSGKAALVYAYYHAAYRDAERAAAAFEGDRLLGCPSYLAARAQSHYAPTYVYLFTYRSPLFPFMGSFHGLELPLVFGTQKVWPLWILFASEAAYRQSRIVSAVLQDLWTSFAKSGRPRAGFMPWPGLASGYVLRINTKSGWLSNPYPERCAVWMPSRR